MALARNVHELGGASNLLEILANGPVRALRNWPAAMPLMRARLVECRPDVIGGTPIACIRSPTTGAGSAPGSGGRFA